MEAVYHLIAVPVTIKSATVGLLLLQKLCAAELVVGAAGVVTTVTATAKRVVLSQLPVD